MKRLPILFALLAVGATCGDVVYTVVPNYPLEPECPPDLPKSTCEAFTPPGHRLLTSGGPASEAPFFVLDLDSNGVEDFRVVAYGLLFGQHLEGAGANASWRAARPPARTSAASSWPCARGLGSARPTRQRGVDRDCSRSRQLWHTAGPLHHKLWRRSGYSSASHLQRAVPVRRARLRRSAVRCRRQHPLRMGQTDGHRGWPDRRSHLHPWSTPTRPIPTRRSGSSSSPSVAGLLGAGALLLFLERRRTRFMNAGGRVPARKNQPNT